MATSLSAADTSSPASKKTLLEFAWQRHQTYSKNASLCQARFFFLRNLMLVLGVVVIFLSILQPDPDTSVVQTGAEDMPLTVGVGRFFLTVLPIVITALLAFSVKFDRGQNWLLLRGSAETLKMEIYCYRTRVKEYRRNRDEVLAKKIKLISERLKGSAVHQAALRPYENEKPRGYKLGLIFRVILTLTRWLTLIFRWVWAQLFDIRKQADDIGIKDDKFSDLNAEDYLTYRLASQFIWYRNKVQTLDQQLQFLEAGIYIFGGLGTLLAAIGMFNWVAFTVALAGAFGNYRDFKRVEATLVGYNQAADSLYDVHTWWTALTPAQQQQQDNFELLVGSAEAIIRSEHVSWLQDMQDRLAEIYGGPEQEPEKTSNGVAESAESTVWQESRASTQKSA
ncbi:MAG: DUF4231 domain-containing protein [Cyanobacteria bacterium P01_A01_bin.114]